MKRLNKKSPQFVKRSALPTKNLGFSVNFVLIACLLGGEKKV